MQKRPQDRVATADEVVYLLKPWTPALENTSWQEIDELVTSPVEVPYGEASLAETVATRMEPADTKLPKQKPPFNDSQVVSTIPAASTLPETSPRVLGLATTVLVSLAVVIAAGALYLVLTSG